MATRRKGGRRRIRLRNLYEREGAICHICLAAVPWDLPDNHPEAPSSDHVIPRSEGATRGEDGANVKLAHRWCNSHRKSFPLDSVDIQEYRRRLRDAAELFGWRKGTKVRHKLVGWEGKIASMDRKAMTPMALVHWSHGRTSRAALSHLERIS